MREILLRRSYWGWAACGLVLIVLSCRAAPEPTTLPPVPHPSAPSTQAAQTGVVVEPPLLETRPQTPPIRRITERPTSVLVRVGLDTDRSSVQVSCCGEMHVEWGEQSFVSGRSFSVRARSGRTITPIFKLQIAALRDGGQAQSIVERIQSVSGLSGAVTLDASTGLYKVRIGPFVDLAAAELGKRTLSSHGVEDSWILKEGGQLESPALEIRSGDQVVQVSGRWLAIRAEPDAGIRYGKIRYRGRILIFLNERGSLNVIDELSIEEYLRGVVPKELGPDLYPELEALKAQTVAARTYTVRNLGEFSDEGFDICSTPRCQVYGGMEVEHALTDRAIQETVDEVLLWQDEPIEALYSATCGGHTENVGTVFPLKSSEGYLQGVPCLEQGGTHLKGDLLNDSFAAAIVEQFLPPRGESAVELGGQLLRLGEIAGWDQAAEITEPLGDLSGPSIEAFWNLRFGESMRLPLSEIEGTADRPLSALEQAQLLLNFALELGVVRREAVRFAAIEDGELRSRRDSGEEVRFSLTPATVTRWRMSPSDQGALLNLVPGDAIEMVSLGSRVLAVTHEVSRPNVVFDRRSSRQEWQRFRSDQQLSRTVREHIPGFDYGSFEPLERGVSGRVGKLRLIAADGRQEIIEGLPIRWTLDLPDTQFTARRVHPPGKGAGWVFTGKGWGHGVGMCQIGAYGMAQRGNTYRGILSHYYSGVTLGKVSAVVRNVRQRTSAR